MREELESLRELAGHPRELGNLTRAAENARAAWGWTWLERLGQDLRYAVRSLRSSPGFALVAVATLALAIGANTTVFTAVNAAYFTKLPVKGPGELWQLTWSSRKRAFGGMALMQPMYDAFYFNQGLTLGGFSYPAYQAIRDKNTSFSDVACSRNSFVTLVTGNYYRLLGVNAALGRTIGPEDDRADRPAVAMLSYGYWQSQFGGDPGVIGRVITRGRFGADYPVPMTIIGVLPQGFFGLDPATAGPQVIAAMQPELRNTPQSLTDNRNWNACDTVIARLAPGAGMERARAETEALTAQSIAADPPPEPYEAPHVKLLGLEHGQPSLRTGWHLALLILTLAVAAFLLIACANIAGLLLARGSWRTKEIATRLALGAGRMRIVRQLLTESLLLSALGSAAGIAIAFALGPELPRLSTRRYTLPNLGVKIQPDWTVIGFSVGIAVLATLLFGLAPALKATRVDLVSMMKTQTSSRAAIRFLSGRAMLVVQVALSFVLLIGAGLLLHTLYNLRSVPMGYNPKGLLFFTVQLPQGHPEEVEETLERLRAVPGVSSANASRWPLFTAAPDTYIQVCIPGDVPKDFDDRFADSDVMLPAFFETWGVPLLRGRDFNATDGPGNVVVNEAFVKRYLKGDVVGQSFRWGQTCAAEVSIIGVVGDSTEDPRVTPRPFVYRRWAQPPPQMTYTVRTPGDTAAVAPLQRIVTDLNTHERVIEELSTGEQYFNDSLGQVRLYVWLLSGFGVLALFVACLGIYGMLAYLVARRTAEIGIRMALGAQRAEVMRLVIRESMLPVCAGIAAGLAAAYPLTRVVASLLFGVSRNDPWTLAGAAGALLATAAAAAFLPARRATRIDPMRALRYE